MNIDDRSTLERAYEALSAKTTFPDHASAEEQDVWMGKVECDGIFAGMIRTVLAGGRISHSALEVLRAAYAYNGSALSENDAAAVMTILAKR